MASLRAAKHGVSDDRPGHRRGGLDLWGGHFERGPAPLMEQINASIGFDKRLYAQDIAGSVAHARMLRAVGLLEEAECAAILAGLEQVRSEIESGRFAFRTDLEDIHMNVEARLTELTGEPGRRLHTARSRNDQVATDLRLWVRGTIERTDRLLAGLQAALLDQAEAHDDAIMPGFTHLQAAQPVILGHHLLAYVEMLGRDRGRFRDARARLNESPLGAAALAGTSFPIDRTMTAADLGFGRPMANSIDAVSDRDFVLEFLAAAAITAVHLSRFAEELVLWSTPQFAFVRIGEEFTSGSSIMPQKRNPDAAELVRGKAGRIVGALSAVLIVLKGLPLAYSKDLQEDKEPLFDAADNLALCLEAMAAMMTSVRFDRERLRAAAGVGHVTATDLADWLVRTLRLPFREAHGIAARAVALAEARGSELAGLDLGELRAIEPRITADVFEVLSVERSVASRTSQGGTAPERVREAIAAARARFLR
ncbi:MAG TPA: argininosuccinate lyase [Geminicoccaceae bacterium]